VQEHADAIDILYLKDRRRDYSSVPFGEGDTPIREIVRLIRQRRNPIRCYLDCDYASADRTEDIRRTLDFIRRSA
jgi:hypothetical protein